MLHVILVAPIVLAYVGGFSPPAEVGRLELKIEREIVGRPHPGQFVMDNKNIVVARNTDAMIFDINGDYIGKIGGKGEGPGEFYYVMSMFLTDDWIVVDDSREIEVFDRQGKFLFQDTTKISNGVWLGEAEGLVGIDLKRRRSINEGEGVHALGYFKVEGEKFIEVTSFHQAEPILAEYSYWFLNHFICRVGDELCVFNEIEQKAYLYDVVDMRPNRSVEVVLPKFVPGPGSVEVDTMAPYGERYAWVFSWSRVFAVKGLSSDEFAVGYWVPKGATGAVNPQTDDIKDTYIAKLNKTTGSVNRYWGIEDDSMKFVGTHDGQLVIIHTKENDDGDEVTLSFMKW